MTLPCFFRVPARLPVEKKLAMDLASLELVRQKRLDRFCQPKRGRALDQPDLPKAAQLPVDDVIDLTSPDSDDEKPKKIRRVTEASLNLVRPLLPPWASSSSVCSSSSIDIDILTIDGKRDGKPILDLLKEQFKKSNGARPPSFTLGADHCSHPGLSGNEVSKLNDSELERANSSYTSASFLESLVCRIRWLATRGEDNVHEVAWLGHISKKCLRWEMMNRIAFRLYIATWNAKAGTSEGFSYLQGWAGCWRWWIETAIARKAEENWGPIVDTMENSGFVIRKYPTWPEDGAVVFQNRVCVIKTSVVMYERRQNTISFHFK